jgi:hypothetical protein
MTEQLDPYEALNKYYKLKNEYETKLNQMKKPIFSNVKLTIAEKRNRLKELQPKCISCNKNGGTLFIDKDRKLQAKCGGTSPCNLNIQIQKSSSESYNEILRNYQSVKEQDKDEIIITKLNLIFQFIDEPKALSLFKKQKNEFEENNNFYTEYVKEFMEQTKQTSQFNKENKIINQEIIDTRKQIESYVSEKKYNEAMSLYVYTLIPLVKKYKNLSNSSYYVEPDGAAYNFNTEGLKDRRLKAIPNELSDFEFEFERPKIIS